VPSPSNGSTKTHGSYRDVLNNYVLPTLGSMPLKKITTRHVDHLFLAMAQGKLPKPEGKRGKSLSSRTIRLTRNVLGQVLDQARRWDLLQSNPVGDSELPRLEPRFPDAPLDAGEVEAFLQAAAGEHYYVFLRLLFEVGLRPGEAAGLRWEDFDEQRSVLHIRHSVGLGADGPKAEVAEDAR
jgi:integrase